MAAGRDSGQVGTTLLLTAQLSAISVLNIEEHTRGQIYADAPREAHRCWRVGDTCLGTVQAGAAALPPAPCRRQLGGRCTASRAGGEFIGRVESAVGRTACWDGSSKPAPENTYSLRHQR